MLKAQHTVAGPHSVLKFIQKQYPSVGAVECSLLELGCNDNYRIKSQRQDYVFRLFVL
ncbi:MAG: hypothetical protein OQK75_00475 [Gammaproteobacteria bacterium]|nr:hypothetical protein [Gammaproteobacteria bacterium]MCW8986119.1 hypothetical protein [Gammaproteobacteria bacterium]MCW9031905.1 hypothetical protein [Gammaproteobacteria bacterium]